METYPLWVSALLTGLGLPLLWLASPVLGGRGRDGFVPRTGPPWGFGAPALSLAAGFLTVLALGPWVVSGGPLAPLVASAATSLVAALVGTLAVRRFPDGYAAMGIGLAPSSSLRAAGAYALALPLIIGASNLWPYLLEALGHTAEPQEILLDVLALEGWPRLVAFFLAAVLAPVGEETVFRGLLQPSFVARHGPRTGVVLTSLLFALLHGASAAGAIFTLSLVLGWIRLRTESLSAVIVVHGLHNALTLAIAFQSPPAT